MTTRTLTCELTPGQIKAALLFASKLDTRGYLNGICIDYTAHGVRLIATDGHRLLCIQVNDTPVDGSPQRFVIGREVLESVVKGFGKVPGYACVWEQTTSPDPQRAGVTIVGLATIHLHGVATTDVQDTMGKFPEYERIIPEQCSGKTGQFNSAYITDCAKARKALGIGYSDHVFIAHNGEHGAALVEISDKAFAVVMPMRGEVTVTRPLWFNGHTQSEEKQAA